MSRERELRDEICDLGRTLFDRGHIAPTDGNVSARLDDDTLLLTPSQQHKGRLASDAIVAVDLTTGKPLRAGQRASTELALHLAIYRARPDVHAIVHSHSPFTVALTVAGVSLARPVVPEVVFALGGVPTIPYASPTTTDVPDAMMRHAPDALAFVLERHGPVALGTSLSQAYQRIEIVEHTAKITGLALSFGSAEPLSDGEIAKLRGMAVAAGFLPR